MSNLNFLSEQQHLDLEIEKTGKTVKLGDSNIYRYNHFVNQLLSWNDSQL